MIKDIDMLLSLFTTVAAPFGRTNRADEPVGSGMNLYTSGEPLRPHASFFLTATFYSSLIVLHIHKGTNSLLCLLDQYWLNTGHKCWRAVAASCGNSDLDTPNNGLSICF
jgi:hypothetical protein